MKAAAFCLFLAASGLNAGEAPDLAEACRKIRAEIAGQRKRLSRVRSEIRKKREALRSQLLELEKAIGKAEGERIRLEREEAGTRSEIERTESKVSELTGELDRTLSVLRENRKEMEAVLLRTGPVGGVFKELDGILEADGGRTAEAWKMLFGIYRRHFDRVCRLRRVAREVVLPDGSKAGGELLLAGGFIGLFRSPRGEAGIVTLPPGTDSYHVIMRGLSRSDRKAIRDAFEGKGKIVSVPLDISDGLALLALEQRRSFWEFLRAGGILSDEEIEQVTGEGPVDSGTEEEEVSAAEETPEAEVDEAEAADAAVSEESAEETDAKAAEDAGEDVAEVAGEAGSDDADSADEPAEDVSEGDASDEESVEGDAAPDDEKNSD